MSQLRGVSVYLSKTQKTKRAGLTGGVNGKSGYHNFQCSLNLTLLLEDAAIEVSIGEMNEGVHG